MKSYIVNLLYEIRNHLDRIEVSKMQLSQRLLLEKSKVKIQIAIDLINKFLL